MRKNKREAGMKKRSRIIIGFIAIGVVIFAMVWATMYLNRKTSQTSDVPKTEQTKAVEVVVKTPEQVEFEKRLETLKVVKGKLKLNTKAREGDRLKCYWFWGIENRYDWERHREYAVESIWVQIFDLGGNLLQKYEIEGLGEEVSQVRWQGYISSGVIECSVVRKEDKLEYEPLYVGEEKAKELFEKGRQYYLEVREYFGVDTREGLETVIKKELLGNLDFK